MNVAPGQLEIREMPIPHAGTGEVRIRVAACGICATDVQMIRGWERTGFPSIPGHEWAGIVDEVGPGVSDALLEAHVVGENVLSSGGEVGFEYPGGYAEYLVTEASKLQVLPDDYPLTTATLIEPLAVCVRGLRRLRRDAQGPYLIFGDGPIGLIFLMLLVSQGHEVVLVGERESRLKLARELGAKQVVNFQETGMYPVGGLRFSSIIEASGSVNALEASLELASVGARVLIVGDYENAMARFEWNKILHSELELIGSNASAGAWSEAVRTALESIIPLERIITHVLPADKFAQGISMLEDKSSNAVKIVLTWF
ncbi:MAG: zinc-dependent alcohol dehydrogenase [Armatimonadota bacterium]